MGSIARFVKVLSDVQCISDELTVPHVFCKKYGSGIPLTVKLILRNGYEIWLDFEKEKERFVGLRFFSAQLSLKGGQCLIFHYCGGFDFKVCILDVDGCEIEYPNVVHHLQTCIPRNVSLYDGGLSFATSINPDFKQIDEVVVPGSFVDRIGNMLPEKLDLVVSCGICLVGSFDRTNCKLFGVASISNMFGYCEFTHLNKLVFNYVMGNTFNVMAFDPSMTETAIYPVPSRHGENVNGNSTAFEILVHPFHMLPYCHGVDVSVIFRDIRDWWRRIDCITAYKDNRCWKLQIRKRRDWKRTTIHDGWIVFRDDLDLAVGDICVFQWKNDTIRNFDIRIVRAVVDIP